MAAQVTLGLDDTQLRAGLASASGAVNRFANDSAGAASKAGNAIKSAFAFAGGIAAVHQLGFAIKGLLSDFDDINDSATKLGISAESFQRIKLAAELSGGSVDGLTTALLKMEAGLQRGGTEGEKLSAALQSLGISVEAFTAAKPEEKLQLLAAGFQKARAEGKGLSEIQDLFKKQFTELIPLLSASSEEMAKMASQKVVSDADVARLAAANDSLDMMTNNIKVIAATSLSSLMGEFTFIDDKVKAITSGTVGLIDALQLIANPTAFAIRKAKEFSGKSTPEDASKSSAEAVVASISTTTASSGIPGLEAATGKAFLPDIPGFEDAAKGPQVSSAERIADLKKQAVTADKHGKEQLAALIRNNEILEKLTSY